ncbi:craniofacial development protein 2-like [Amphiura filiformis]|uniref:craniofacial development protein 2-like n=1 Tax=Amphiura filiformis TaxID=82378 RepID=UPI003B225F30
MATTKRNRVKAPTLNPSSESVLATNINDVSTLKPHGRVCTERGGTRTEKLLRCKQSMFVSTLNTRTLRSIYLQEEICGLAKRYNQDITGLQEHKIVNPDEPIRHHDLFDGYQLVSSSAWRNRAGIAVGGVGILMSAKAKKTLLSCICITPRKICATFGGSPKTTIIVTYCPTNVSDEKESEEHYMLLDKYIKQVSAHNFLMVMGDFNARVGKEHYKFPYHDSTNRNGELLHTLAIENELEIANVSFCKKNPCYGHVHYHLVLRHNLTTSLYVGSGGIAFSIVAPTTPSQALDQITVLLQQKYVSA